LALLCCSPPAPTPTPKSETGEPSGPGGIGNTRGDIFDYWNIVPTTEPAFEYSVDHKHDVTYDTEDYQIGFLFQLRNDDKIRKTDRVILIVISLISSTTVSQGERLAENVLPEDAKKDGPRSENRFKEPVQRYHSERIEDLFPRLEIEGEHPGNPGQVWVTIYPGQDSESVIELALFDSSVY